jgi:hypothetical protein
MKYLWLVLVLLVAGCGAPADGRLLLIDPAGQLERAQVEVAARPLIARGVALAVIAVPVGDQSGADFTRRLEVAGLLPDGRIAPEAIALYVSFAPRYSELRAGTNWSARLPSEALREIRLASLNPALRAGAASEGVAATLAALDAQLVPGRFGALISRWVLLAVVAAALVLILFSHRLRGWLAWAGMSWSDSAAGRLAERLWEHSPPGRALARRWLARETEWARQRLARSAAGARDELADITASTADLANRLQQLDQRYSALEQRSPTDTNLPSELHALSADYRRLGEDVAGRLRELGRWSAGLQSAAKEARVAVERVAATFQGASKLRPPRSKRAPKLRRELPNLGRKRRQISDAGQAQIAELRERCQQLDQQRVTLADLGLPAPELVERQKRLASEYEKLTQAVLVLWQAEAPWAYQAYLAAQAAATAALSPASETYGSSSETNYSSGSSADTTSTYDYSSSSDYSSASEPSSDGGSW